MKHRVLIRVHCVRRDAAPMTLLAGVLERMGCETLLASVRSFDYSLKMWKPHATVVGTLGQASDVKRQFPSTKVIFVDQEGYKGPQMTHADQWSSVEKPNDKFDLAILWGRRVVDELKAAKTDVDFDKICVAGNPSLDLVKYMPTRLNCAADSNSVGFVSRFHNINDYHGHMVIRRLLNSGNPERTRIQISGFVALMEAARAILQNTNMQVSIRPHPMEQIESYQEYLHEWFGDAARRVSIDTSIDFASWAARQRVIASPSSTSFILAYLLNVPTVNLDRISGTFDFNQAYAPVMSEWQEGAITPATMEEFCGIVKSDRLSVPHSDAIEKQLNDYCHWDEGGAACYRIARHILESLRTVTAPNALHWPKIAVEIRDIVSFHRAMRSNQLHHNFCHSSRFHETPAHFTEMADAIMKEYAGGSA